MYMLHVSLLMCFFYLLSWRPYILSRTFSCTFSFMDFDINLWSKYWHSIGIAHTHTSKHKQTLCGQARGQGRIIGGHRPTRVRPVIRVGIGLRFDYYVNNEPTATNIIITNTLLAFVMALLCMRVHVCARMCRVRRSQTWTHRRCARALDPIVRELAPIARAHTRTRTHSNCPGKVTTHSHTLAGRCARHVLYAMIVCACVCCGVLGFRHLYGI